MSKAKVLVVEDNAITRKMMRLALESEGYGVFEAPDGKTAVRLARTENPTLIVQDLLLPDIDGLDLVKELRRSLSNRQIPILACTGLMSKLDEGRAVQGGFTDYLFKPVEPSRLLQVVERYLCAPAGQTKKTDRQLKVLLVDDNAVELKLEKLVLEAEGFSVTTAKDGREAWETAHWLDPDAVLCDLIMPNMNGFDLCLALRKHSKFASLPIVITSSTASGIDDERRVAEKVGADAFVVRTPDLKEAVRALRDALDRTSHPQPAPDSETLKDNYVQRLVSQLEQQTARNGELIRRASEEKAQLAVVASITDTLNRKLSLQAALDEALARILDAAGISLGAVYLAEAGGKLVLKSQIGPEAKLGELQDFFGHSALLDRALEERRAIKMPSPEIAAEITEDLRAKVNARSLLIAPLVVADDPQGVLVAFSSRSELEDDWVGSVKTVTVQLAQAVLLARTLQAAQQNLARIRALHEIDKAITSTLKLNTVLEVLLDKVGVFLPIAAASTVRLLDPETGELESLACRGLDEKAWRSQARTTLEEGRTQRVVESKAPLAVADINKEGGYKPGVLQGMVSYLGVPLIAHDAVLGILGLYTRHEHEFTPEEIDFLDTLAGQAAIAIHNARLYEKMARANKVKDEFLSVMSHELRTPLTVVMGYTGLIKEGTLGKINRLQEDALDKVLVRAGDQLELINEIMQTTQLEARAISPHFKPFNLRELLDQLRSDYKVRAVKSGVSLKWDYPETSIPITSDGLKLKQILSNLINNALKFTESGTVTVSAQIMDRSPIPGLPSSVSGLPSSLSCPSPNSARFVQFTVTDTGIGISKKMQEIIFNKFIQADASETRSYGGIGLGLYIVRQYTDLLGGKIELQSEPGRGSTFTVRIPCARAEAPAPTRRPVKDEEGKRRLRVES
jgi:signal transduction histidine kinase/CheY-like chemotaxis protein